MMMIDSLIDEKNGLIFVEIEFHSNENIEWHWIEFKYID
jgi:hypothetical protein